MSGGDSFKTAIAGDWIVEDEVLLLAAFINVKTQTKL